MLNFPKFPKSDIMNKPTIRFLAIAIGCLFFQSLWIGCSSDKAPTFGEKAIKNTSRNLISVEEAVSLACNAIGQGEETRSSVSANIGYILNDGLLTRCSTLPDTLAYIINFESDRGFALVSTIDIPEPVMAYSPEGRFVSGNELVETYILPNVAPYMEMQISSDIENQTVAPSYCIKNPPKPLNLGQRSPWNKYVDLHSPGCPVGCLAVATAYLLLHTQVTFDYGGETYNCFKIKNPISNHNTPPKPPVTPTIDPILAIPQPDQEYSEAIDKVAYMLDWIGKEENMTYGKYNSYAYFSSAAALLERLGLQDDLRTIWYSPESAAEHIMNDYIIYVQGRKTSNNSGHAWLIDGCKIKYYHGTPNPIQETYLHFDWGWDGDCNGYYQGKLIDVTYGQYKVTEMMPIKITYDNPSVL